MCRHIYLLAISLLACSSQSLGWAQPPKSAGQVESSATAAPSSSQSNARDSAAGSRSLDDMRRQLQERGEDAGMMSGSAEGGMAGGMGMGMGMMGMGYGGSAKDFLAQRIHQLRRQLGDPKAPRPQIEKQLAQSLQRYFEVDMQERVQKFDQVKARVIELEAKLQRRLDNERDIIDLQLKQMLHQADGLDFSVPGSDDGMSGGYGGGPYAGEEPGGGYGGPGMGMSMGMEGDFGGYGSMWADGGYGAAEDTGKIGGNWGYDARHGITRNLRPDINDLDDTDPIKTYGANQPIAGLTSSAVNNADKLKRILLAFHEFHQRFHHFPRSSLRVALDQPPHSWRVAILPLIGESELFRAYHFDQPWDSPANLAVADRMPDLYRSQAAEPNSTQFMLTVGDGAFDSAVAPPTIRDITDGTSNTVVLIQSAQAVPWTKPADAMYSANGPLPTLAPSQLLGLADGSVKVLPSTYTEQDFRALLTRAGDETVNLKLAAP